MGGRGGHNSKGKLRDVQCARLDANELARDATLTLGKRGTLFGTVGFEVAGGPDAQQLVLEFPVRSVSGERLAPVQQVICCYWRKAQRSNRARCADQRCRLSTDGGSSREGRQVPIPHPRPHAAPPHGLQLANDGQDTRAIQAYLGQRSIVSTQRYTALAPDRFKKFWKDGHF